MSSKPNWTSVYGKFEPELSNVAWTVVAFVFVNLYCLFLNVALPSLSMKNCPFSASSHSLNPVRTFVVTACDITFFTPVSILLSDEGNPIAFKILETLAEDYSCVSS